MVTIYMTSFVLLFRLVPVYWKEELHIGEATIGMLMGMNGVVIALFEMVLIQKLGSRRPDAFYIVAGVLFTAIAYLFLVVPILAPVVIGVATVLLFTVGEMLTLPYISTIVMNRASASNRGQYSAAYSLSWAVAQIIGPAAGGYIAQHWGYNILWFVLVLLSMACALGFKMLFQNVVKLS